MSLASLFHPKLSPQSACRETYAKVCRAWSNPLMKSRIVDDVMVPLFVTISKRYHNPSLMESTQSRIYCYQIGSYHPFGWYEPVLNTHSLVAAMINAGEPNMDHLCLQLAFVANPDILVHLIEVHVQHKTQAYPHNFPTSFELINWAQRPAQNIPNLEDPAVLVGLMRSAGAIKPFTKAVLKAARGRRFYRKHCNALLKEIDAGDRRLIAIAMVLHARLGQQSQMAGLSAELVRDVAWYSAGEEAPEINDMELYYR